MKAVACALVMTMVVAAGPLGAARPAQTSKTAQTGEKTASAPARSPARGQEIVLDTVNGSY